MCVMSQRKCFVPKNNKTQFNEPENEEKSKFLKLYRTRNRINGFDNKDTRIQQKQKKNVFWNFDKEQRSTFFIVSLDGD